MLDVNLFSPSFDTRLNLLTRQNVRHRYERNAVIDFQHPEAIRLVRLFQPLVDVGLKTPFEKIDRLQERVALHNN